MDQEWHLHYDQTDGLGASKTYTIHTFWFQSFTRKVNHIVFLLDKWTITERILQDDVAIVPLLGSFTAAQISEFIRLASEKGCTNVTALLLEYQNEHFGQFDPMAEFTLGE
jgi:predicted ThiF/HesA family dinucleotide-utilizing enzyme